MVTFGIKKYWLHVWFVLVSVLTCYLCWLFWAVARASLSLHLLPKHNWAIKASPSTCLIASLIQQRETLQRRRDFALTTNSHWACSDRLVSNRCMATHLDFAASLKPHSVALHLVPSFCRPQCIHCIPLIFYFFVSPNEEQQTASCERKSY